VCCGRRSTPYVYIFDEAYGPGLSVRTPAVCSSLTARHVVNVYQTASSIFSRSTRVHSELLIWSRVWFGSIRFHVRVGTITVAVKDLCPHRRTDLGSQLAPGLPCRCSSTDRGRRALTSVNVPLGWPWSPPQVCSGVRIRLNRSMSRSFSIGTVNRRRRSKNELINRVWCSNPLFDRHHGRT